jgi:hypothetical protein
MPDYTIPSLDGGICLSDLAYKLDPGQSSDMSNMWFNDKVLNKRWGQSTTATNLNGVVRAWHDETYQGFGVFHAGNHLYKYDITNGTATSLTNAASNVGGSFFNYSDSLYYFDTVKYWAVNTNFAVAEVTPFVPVTFTGCTPNLSASTAYQDFNMIGAGFEVWYTADATNLYTLPGTGTLDATLVTAIVAGVNKAETTDFTVDRTNRKVTFSVAPANTGVLNGVRIRAYQADATAANKIKNCKLAIPFGGDASSLAGGTRIFVSGNSNYPTTYWRSGLKDPTYWPETQHDLLDNNNQAITQFDKQYGKLIAFKSKSIYSIDYSFDGTNVLWPTKEIHASVGCDMPGSVQLIDNRLVFFNSERGGFILDRIDQTSENNVKPISNNINGTKVNPGILAESLANLQACKSIDFGRKYWLNLPNGKAYLWDYDISPYYDNGDYSESQRRLKWFPFTNIYAGAWFAYNQSLYYGRVDEGSATKLEDTFLDYGAAISCYWQSKAFDFDLPQFLKTVQEVIIGLRTDTNTSVTIEYLDEKKEKIDSKTITVGSFSWAYFSWEVFTWQFYRYAQQIRRKPKRKKIVYFSIKLSNNQASRDLGITDLTFIYEKNRRVK